MLAFNAIFASGAITAVGCTPVAMIEASRNRAAAFANATLASFARIIVFPVTESPGGRITHAAADALARAVCFAASTKIKSPDDARSGAATPVNSIEASPSTTASIASAKSFAVCFIMPPKSSIRANSCVLPGSQKIVNWQLALRSCLPTRMHPDPLFRILSNNLFSHFRKAPSVFDDVALCVACSNEFQRRFEPQPILFQRFVPHGVSRYNRGPCVKRHARDTGGRAGWHTEKIHEGSFIAHRVLVGKDADGAGFFQDSKHQACRFVLENRRVSGQPAITVHQPIEARVIE